MAELSWQDIERGCARVKRRGVFWTFAAFLIPFFAWTLGLALWSVAVRKGGVSRLEILTVTTAFLWLLPLLLIASFRLQEHLAESKLAKCPTCHGPIGLRKAMLLELTGRCGHCGSRVEVSGTPLRPSVGSEVPGAQLIPRELLQAQTLSRPAQITVACSLGAFFLPILLLFIGVPVSGFVFASGAVAMGIGIISSLIMLHVHQRKCGGPPSCPHCKLRLRPFASNFVLMTARCGRCRRSIAEPPVDTTTPAIVRLTRAEFASAWKHGQALVHRWFWFSFCLFMLGVTAALWALVYWGSEVAEVVFHITMAWVVLTPIGLWWVERKRRLEPRLRCPDCREPLIGSGKIMPEVLVTGRCWNCAGKVFPED